MTSGYYLKSRKHVATINCYILLCMCVGDIHVKHHQDCLFVKTLLSAKLRRIYQQVQKVVRVRKLEGGLILI